MKCCCLLVLVQVLVQVAFHLTPVWSQPGNVCVEGNEAQWLGPEDYLDLAAADLGASPADLEPLNNVKRGMVKAALNFARTTSLLAVSRDYQQYQVTIGPVFLQAERVLGPATFQSTNKLLNRPLSFPARRPDPYLCEFYKYYCPYRTRVLWALIHNGEICLVPWPNIQLVTYAQCLCPNCLAPFRNGRCLPSDYQLRKMLVLCRKSNGVWYWQLVIKLLPQACSCRTC